MGRGRSPQLSRQPGRSIGIVTRDVILDANVIVSAQLVQHPLAPPFRLFVAALGGPIQNHVSPQLLDEYRGVLLRPSVARRHGLSPSEVHQVVEVVRRFAIELSPPRSWVAAPDANDQHVWDMLAAYHELMLVTGDPPLLASHHFPGRILSPRDFVDRFLAT